VSGFCSAGLLAEALAEVLFLGQAELEAEVLVVVPIQEALQEQQIPAAVAAVEAILQHKQVAMAVLAS